jgi:hypothetical protein
MVEQDLMAAVVKEAGLRLMDVGVHIEFIIRTSSAGHVYSTGARHNNTHEIFLQFEGDTLPGDVEIFMVPTVGGQFYRRLTVNRQFSETWTDTSMNQVRFITATAERLSQLAVEQGFVFCEGSSCSALTFNTEDKCHACGAELQSINDDEGEEDEAPTEAAAATLGAATSASSTAQAAPAETSAQLPLPGVTL